MAANIYGMVTKQSIWFYILKTVSFLLTEKTITGKKWFTFLVQLTTSINIQYFHFNHGMSISIMECPSQPYVATIKSNIAINIYDW